MTDKSAAIAQLLAETNLPPWILLALDAAPEEIERAFAIAIECIEADVAESEAMVADLVAEIAESAEGGAA